jgi:hypothetical protein
MKTGVVADMNHPDRIQKLEQLGFENGHVGQFEMQPLV